MIGKDRRVVSSRSFFLDTNAKNDCDFVITEKLTLNPGMWKEKLMVWEAEAYLLWCIQVTAVSTLGGDTIWYTSP